MTLVDRPLLDLCAWLADRLRESRRQFALGQAQKSWPVPGELLASRERIAALLAGEKDIEAQWLQYRGNTTLLLRPGRAPGGSA